MYISKITTCMIWHDSSDMVWTRVRMTWLLGLTRQVFQPRWGWHDFYDSTHWWGPVPMTMKWLRWLIIQAPWTLVKMTWLVWLTRQGHILQWGRLLWLNLLWPSGPQVRMTWVLRRQSPGFQLGWHDLYDSADSPHEALDPSKEVSSCVGKTNSSLSDVKHQFPDQDVLLVPDLKITRQCQVSWL